MLQTIDALDAWTLTHYETAHMDPSCIEQNISYIRVLYTQGRRSGIRPRPFQNPEIVTEMLYEVL